MIVYGPLSIFFLYSFKNLYSIAECYVLLPVHLDACVGMGHIHFSFFIYLIIYIEFYVLLPVHLDTRYTHVMKTNLMHNLASVYFVN